MYTIYASPSGNKNQLVKQEANSQRLADKWVKSFIANSWVVYKVVEHVAA